MSIKKTVAKATRAGSLAALALSAMLVVGCGDDSNPANGGSQNFNTVRIGNRTWMAENLNHQTNDSWCYGNDESNCAIYGRMYTWNAARSACSGLGGGWRLPSNEDWSALVTAAGGDWTAASRLKSQTDWPYFPGVSSSTDEFGFSALPGGRRSADDASFRGVGIEGFWWSATEDAVATNARSWGMLNSSDAVRSWWDNKNWAYSVRCVKD